jgi:uncharacterized protein
MTKQSHVTISVPTARRLWLHAQRLDATEPFGAGPDAVQRAVTHLGYVQIDTINVIERCHHHILWNRIPAYQRDDLAHAQSEAKSVFEYWTHALAYVPTEHMAYFLPAMRAYRARALEGWFGTTTPADLRKALRRLKTEGPLTIRDIDDDELVEKTHLWASRKPSKKALQLAFFRGEAAISAREGMVKRYDLFDRHFEVPLPKPATAKAVLEYKLERALRAQAIVTLDSICHLDARSKPAVRTIIEARVRRGELRAVAIEGLDKVEFWAAPQSLDAHLDPTDIVHILSPFDPLIIQRKRLKMLFDYDHLFEAYVPKEKRKLGYFALPVLIGDRVVAAIDIKADRATKSLMLQQWTWTDAARRRADKPLIEAALDRFAAFQFAG